MLLAVDNKEYNLIKALNHSGIVLLLQRFICAFVMKRRIYLVVVLLLSSFLLCLGQNPQDSITMKKVFGGYQFFQGEKILNMSKLVNAMKPNEQAYKEIKSARTTYVFANIVGGIGGALVGWPVGAAVGGGEPNWTLAAIGAGVIIVSIPISIKFNKQAKIAVNTFNSDYRSTTFRDKSELRFSLSGSGIGLALSF
jgi:hypothetical protein